MTWNKTIDGTSYQNHELNISYDLVDQALVIRSATNLIDVPLSVIKDLLSTARLEIWESAEVERFVSAIKSNQDERYDWEKEKDRAASSIKSHIEAEVKRRVKRIETKDWRSGKTFRDISPKNAKLLQDAMDLIDQRDQEIEALRKQVLDLRTGMGQIIASAQREINRLKEKCGE